MRRFVPVLFLAASIAAAAPLSADPAETPSPANDLPQITQFNGTGWAALERHAIWVTGAGATTEGTATATLKSKLDGPKTYVVIAGTTSELMLKDPRPRFRIESDRTGAETVQLAEFEADDTVRSTTIERVRRGVFFTKGIDLEVTKIAEGVWEIRPTKSLQPGEYALATTDSDPVADFTIVATGY
jgi:hypothetical protein